MDHNKGRRREICQIIVVLLLLSFITNNEKRFIELQKKQVSTVSRGNVFVTKINYCLSQPLWDHQNTKQIMGPLGNIPVR